MPMVAHRRSSSIAILILNISTSLRLVISSCPDCCTPRKVRHFPLQTQHSGPQGWSGQAGEIENLFPPLGFISECPACRYTIYAIPPASHKEGDGMTMAYSRDKNHENYDP